jgi:hypothetical protein
VAGNGLSSRGRTDCCADLGLGDRGRVAFRFRQAGDQLLRPLWGGKSSADKVMRTTLSKQRNEHIQRVLVEAAKLAPRYSHELALVREKELQKGNPNRATLAVARKMVAYPLAVDREQRDFVSSEERSSAVA